MKKFWRNLGLSLLLLVIAACITICFQYCQQNAISKKTHAEAVRAHSKMDAMSVVVNKASKDSDVAAAIKILETEKLGTNFWMTIGNNSEYPADHRRRCIGQALRSMDWRLTELNELGRFLKTPGLINKEEITQIKYLFGWLPIKWNGATESLFSFSVLEKPEGQYSLAVLVTFSPIIDQKKFSDIFLGAKETNIVINALTVWDSDDVTRMYGKGHYDTTNEVDATR